jgi:hypothetical protein
MLEKSIEMDTGVYSEICESILYIVRLSVRLEAHIFFLVRNGLFITLSNKNADEKDKLSGAYYEALVRGLDYTEMSINDALGCLKKIRILLDEKIFKIIARWIKRAKEDGHIAIACMLHAHIAYLFRNVEYAELTPTKVFAILASQIFLFSNFKYDIDLDLKDTKSIRNRKLADTDIRDDLGISQVELFDMFQLNRNKIMNWLLSDSDHRNAVLNIINFVSYHTNNFFRS